MLKIIKILFIDNTISNKLAVWSMFFATESSFGINF